jgi:hypothetical protein
MTCKKLFKFQTTVIYRQISFRKKKSQQCSLITVAIIINTQESTQIPYAHLSEKEIKFLSDYLIASEMQGPQTHHVRCKAPDKHLIVTSEWERENSLNVRKIISSRLREITDQLTERERESVVKRR